MANRTQFVIEAVANGAVYELDKLEHREKAVAQGMKEIAKEAQVAEYKIAESAKRMQTAIHTQGGAFMAAGRSATYGVAAAPIVVPAAQHVAAATMGYGVANQSTFAGSFASQFTGRDQGQHTDPHAARLRAEAIATQVRNDAKSKRLAIAEEEAKRELAIFESNWAHKKKLEAEGQRMLGTMKAGAGVALAFAATKSIESLQEAELRVRAFTNDFRKVATLGGNIDDIGGKREQVLAFSNAWGTASEEVVKGIYAIESAASNLSKTDQAELLKGALQFNRMQGTSLEDGGKAILKYREIYSDSVQSIVQAKNRLYKVADLGDLDIDKAARFMPDLLSRGKAIGFSDVDVGGMTVTATQKLGRTEKTLTSLGDVMMKMPEAAKRLGFTMTGTLKDFESLNQFKPTQLLEVFGTDVGTLKVIMDNQKAVKDYAAELKGIGPVADEVGEKLKKMWGDKPLAYAELQEMYDQTYKNMPANAGYVDKYGQSDLDWKARRAAIRTDLPEYLSWLAEPEAWRETIVQGGAEKVSGGGMAGEIFKAVIESTGNPLLSTRSGDSTKTRGQQMLADQLKAAGRTDIDPTKPLDQISGAALKDAAKDLKEAVRPAKNRNAHRE